MLMTNHAKIYRAERINWIIDTFGAEEPCLHLPSRMKGFTMQICESGATFITADDTGELITAYVITVAAYRMACKRARKPISDNMLKRIAKNHRLYEEFWRI